jgi:hypothetical protein
MIQEKKTGAKNLVTLSLKISTECLFSTLLIRVSYLAVVVQKASCLI